MSLVIRPARPGEAGTVLTLVRELAVYEKLLHEVDATEEMIERELFGERPRAFCYIAEWTGEPVGFAVWFYNFSTFRGRCGIYLEDVYVRPELRGKGIGKALLQRLAQRCVEEDLTRFEWSVLDWNTPAVDFYKAMGAELMDGWTICRVEGEALTKLGAKSA